MPALTVRRAKSGEVRYQVRFRLNGMYSSRTYDTEEEAREFIQLCDDLGDPAHALRYLAKFEDAKMHTAMTLDKWFTEYCATRTGVEERTVIEYQRMYDRHIKARLGARPLDAIERTDVAALVNALSRPSKTRKKALSAKTIANIHGLLAACFNEAVALRKVEANPCIGLRLPRTGEVERRGERFLTHAEFDRLFAEIDDHYKPLVLTLIGTGIRWAEATALRCGEVDLDGLGTMKIIRATKWTPGQGHTDDGVPKTKKSRRTVIIPAQVKTALRPLMEGKTADEHVFTSATGKSVRHATFHRLIWRPACVAAKLDPPPRIHDLRHSHASWLLEFGMSLEQVQDQLGHESIITTRKVYGHLQPAMREALQKAAEAALAAGKSKQLALDRPAITTLGSVDVEDAEPHDPDS